jgi:hypothetical protein
LYYYGHQTQEDDLGMDFSKNREMRNVYKLSAGKPKLNRNFGRFSLAVKHGVYPVGECAKINIYIF